MNGLSNYTIQFSFILLCFQLPMPLQVSCNHTTLCRKWKSKTCIEPVLCTLVECKHKDLSRSRLSVGGPEFNKYEHGKEILVLCDIGYEFENNEKIIMLRCLKGIWHSRSGTQKIPRCLKYSDCSIRLTENMILTGKSHFIKNRDGTTKINHRATAR